MCIWTWGWIHAYFCVFVCTRLETHSRTYSLHATRITPSAAGWRPRSAPPPAHPLLARLPSSPSPRRSPLEAWRSTEHVAWGLFLRGVTKTEVCIWLCIWCVFASKTKTHRYTRICTPHPLYFPPGLPVVTASKTHITLTLRGPPTPARRGARWRCSCSS